MVLYVACNHGMWVRFLQEALLGELFRIFIAFGHVKDIENLFSYLKIFGTFGENIYMKKNLMFPELHFEHRFDKENAELRNRFKDKNINVITSCPTTVDIIPGVDQLEVILNGQRHHYSYRIPVTFGEKRYRKIYESLKERGARVTPMEYREMIFPDVFKKNEPNFDALDRNDLLEFIKSGKRYLPDSREYFDSKLFDINYVETRQFILMPSGVVYTALGHKLGGNFTFFGKFTYAGLVSRNKKLIKDSIKMLGMTHLYSIETERTWITDELVIYDIRLHCCKTTDAYVAQLARAADL